MLSQKCKYAIRSVLYLASEASPSTLLGGKDVSKALNIPLAFTLKILQELSKSGLISSVKGPGGGFFLSDENLQSPLIKIIDVVDDLSYFNSCGLGLPECSEKHPCPVHDTFKECREKLLRMFSTKSVKQLGHEVNSGDLFVIRAMLKERIK